MQLKGLQELKAYAFENKVEHLFNFVFGGLCGWGADFLAHKFLTKIFHFLEQHYDAKAGVTPPHFEDVSDYARILSVLTAGLVILLLERQLFILHLLRRILEALDKKRQEKASWFASFGAFAARLIEQLVPGWDPVDEKTVGYLKVQLPDAKADFGAITHVPAKKWFAGENYLTILLLQVKALVDRNHPKLPLPALGTAVPVQVVANPLEIFRIIVWPKRKFTAPQSIALLRLLYSLRKDFGIPLKTHLMTKDKFKNFLRQMPGVPKQFHQRQQFWVCIVVENGTDTHQMVFGEKETFKKTEKATLIKNKPECGKCTTALSFLRPHTVDLDTVFHAIDIFDDHSAMTQLKKALDENDALAIPKKHT